MLAMVAAADSASTVRKKYSVFIYSEAEPHAMYAIYKQTLTLCVLQSPKFINFIEEHACLPKMTHWRVEFFDKYCKRFAAEKAFTLQV